MTRQEEMNANPWMAEIIDGLVINWALEEGHYSNPRKAVQDLIAVEVEMALDPKISARAQELITQGYREAKEQASGNQDTK
jgi:hypothetical protein